ncbi:MAG: hypothetical protein PF518_12625 [Spirochaetaceae bacterium]|jgi:mannitol/fructose-specific phosphotransferase system IIA component (Ntr-type)|nr:hypothetical protein [Spirochaetaceae bacterium]
MSDSIERLGEMLQRLGALTDKQINEILNYQKENPTMLFGQIAIKLGFITNELLEKYL